MERMEKLSSMERDFTEYTEALALKELGFDEPCFHLDGLGKVNYAEFGYGATPIPLYSQAFRWFREKHGLYPSIISHDVDNHIFTIVGEENYESDDEQDNFNTYEEVELACLKKLIEIVKEKL